MPLLMRDIVPMRIINAKTTYELLTMDDCILSMRKAIEAISNKKIVMPSRLVMALPESSDFMGVMPAASYGVSIYGTKCLSVHAKNPGIGLPAVQGFMALFDYATGTPIALIDGAALTAIRTAATTALATQILARKDVATQAICGTGAQAQTHAAAILAACPSLKETIVWGRDIDRAEELSKYIAAKHEVSVTCVQSLQEAAGCDIVSMVTSAKTPLLKGAWLKSGSHVNLIGSHSPQTREADTEAICKAQVYVDCVESAKREAGDILMPIQEGKISWGHVVGEIGEVSLGKIRGRKTEEEITLFKSTGVGGQDLFAAIALLKSAEAKGLGELVSM